MGAITRALAAYFTGSILGSLRAYTSRNAEMPALVLFGASAVADYFMDENKKLVIDIVRGVEASSMAVAVTEAVKVNEKQVVPWEEANEEVNPG